MNTLPFHYQVQINFQVAKNNVTGIEELETFEKIFSENYADLYGIALKIMPHHLQTWDMVKKAVTYDGLNIRWVRSDLQIQDLLDSKKTFRNFDE